MQLLFYKFLHAVMLIRTDTLTSQDYKTKNCQNTLVNECCLGYNTQLHVFDSDFSFYLVTCRMFIT